MTSRWMHHRLFCVESTNGGMHCVTMTGDVDLFHVPWSQRLDVEISTAFFRERGRGHGNQKRQKQQYSLHSSHFIILLSEGMRFSTLTQCRHRVTPELQSTSVLESSREFFLVLSESSHCNSQARSQQEDAPICLSKRTPKCASARGMCSTNTKDSNWAAWIFLASFPQDHGEPLFLRLASIIAAPIPSAGGCHMAPKSPVYLLASMKKCASAR
jgi:hypothetical protein